MTSADEPLSDGAVLAAHLPSLAAALEAKGLHALSPWFLATLTTWLCSGKRQLVLRVGRRGGKSTALCLLAVLVVLFGQFHLPLGDVGVIAIVSVSRYEAEGRIRTICAFLRALGIVHRQRGDTIEVEGRPLVVRVFPATTAGVSGFTCVLALCDETAKWRDAETGANPATEVLGSLRPTMATQPNARMVLSSSPMGFDDAHAKAFEAGDTPQQMVAAAATWQANPTISEQQTHELEPDRRVWSREYAAVPQSAVCAALDASEVERAFRPLPANRYFYLSPVLVLDPSSLRGDSFTWCVARWLVPNNQPTLRRVPAFEGDQNGAPVRDAQGLLVYETPEPLSPMLRLESIEGVDGRELGTTTMDAIVRRIARAAADHEAHDLVGDQRESASLEAMFRQQCSEDWWCRYSAIPWTTESKTSAMLELRRLLREGGLSIEGHDQMRAQLLGLEERLLPSGQWSYGGRRGAHDDYAALVLTACMASLAGKLRGAPSEHVGAVRREF